jgi:tetratricopeptide (TPR) repeat protein
VSGLFTSHLHNLRRSSPKVLGLLSILVFWDPDGIELKTIKTGMLSLQSSIEATKEHSKSEQNRHWERFFATIFSRIRLTVGNRVPAVDASKLKSENHALPSDELESLIELVSSEVQLSSAFQELQMLSFIKQRSADEGGAYCMHDLTQTWVQVALESEGTYLQWFICSVRIACTAFREIENPALPESWPRYEGLISHILSLTKYSESVDPENSDLLTARTSIATYWCNRGRYHEAQEAYQQLLAIGIIDDTGVEKTQWTLGLAEVCWHLSKYSESVALYDEVRRTRETRLGVDHPDALDIVEKIALVYWSQARNPEARLMLERVLECRKKSLGPNHLDTIRAIDGLATVVTALGEYAEGESLYKQALPQLDTQLGAHHPDTLWTADNLASNYRDQDRQLEALELHEKVLKGRKLRLGEDHPHTLYTLANVAMVYTTLGRLNEAEVMWKQAIMRNEQRLGQSHRQTLWVVEGLADVYHRQERFEEAIRLYNRALRGKEDLLGDGHPSVLDLVHKLANHYRLQKDFIKSIELFERLLERRKTTLRSGHPDLLRTYHDAATSFASMGKYIEAEQCYRLELSGTIDEFGSLYTETKKREENLARFLNDQELKGRVVVADVPGAVTIEGASSGQQGYNDTQD